jgi:hypothetical protein
MRAGKKAIKIQGRSRGRGKEVSEEEDKGKQGKQGKGRQDGTIFSRLEGPEPILHRSSYRNRRLCCLFGVAIVCRSSVARSNPTALC